METPTTAALAEQWQWEFELTPPEHRRMLLKLAHSFRQSLAEDDADDIDPAESSRQGWTEVQEGKTRPRDGLRESIGPD